MTTDSSSRDVFYKIFKKYDIVTNNDWKNLNKIPVLGAAGKRFNSTEFPV